jgi:peptidyl-prolyl cis-trans isomerase D
MLDLMRRQSYLIYLVFGGIIFIFAVNFGPGSSGCMRNTQAPWAARINGQAVRQQEFAVGYGRQMDYMRRLAQQSGIDFDNAMAERFGIRRKVMEQLVERHLLAQEAEKRGILVSDEDLLAYLRDQYGVKDVTYDVYENWVTRTFETNVQKFEEDARGDVAARRMARIVNDAVDVGEAELKEQFAREHDRARMEYVRFDVDPAHAAEPDAGAIAAALKDEGAALQAAYEADSFTYQTPLEVQVRQIVKKLPAKATPAEEEQARKALMDLAAQVTQGADFAALARAQSDDPTTRDKGGDMGLVRRGQLVTALDDAAFRLQKDALTDAPIRTPEGLHLLQVTDIHAPKRQAFADVRTQVAKNVLQGRSADVAARTQAAAFLAGLNQGKAWAAASTVADDLEMAELPPLAGPGGRSLHKAAADKPTRHTSSWVLRGQPNLGRIGVSKPMHDALFGLTAAAPVAQEAYKVGDAYYVMALKERETPDMQQFAAAKEELYEQAVDSKRARVLKEWLVFLRNEAKVEINTALINSPLIPEEDVTESG